MPSLEFSADSFARLAGPWIDVIGGGYYRLSPLLQNAAGENWGAEKVNSARKALARAMLSSKDRTLLEASEILFQGILSGDTDSVTSVTLGLQSAPLESMRIIAEQLGWLVLLGRTRGTKVFKENNHINFLLRLLQFRILAEQGATGLEDLCHLIDSEFDELENCGEIRHSLRVSWLMMVVFYFQANIQPELLIRYWAELYELFPKTDIFEDISKSFENKTTDFPLGGNKDFHCQCMMMILAREMDSGLLLALARAINLLPSALKTVALAGIRSLLFPLRLAVDRAWVGEIEKANRDWGKVSANFEILAQEVNAWEIPDLLIFIARARAAIEDEYCGNSLKATSILDEAKTIEGSQNQFAEDQRAVVLSRSGKFAEAVAIWKEILPSWPCGKGSVDHVPLYACERAGSVAGKIADWETAIAFFRLGQHFGTLFGEHLHVLSFFADEGFAIWKSGEKSLALKSFAETLTKLELFQVSKTNEAQVHRVRKCFEQILKWCRVDVGYEDEYQAWEPPAGFCSSLGTDEKINDIPASPYDLNWHFLAEIELKTIGADAIFDEAAARAKSSKFAFVRIFSLRLQLEVAFSRFDFANLVGLIHELNQAYADGEAQRRTGKTALQPDAYVPEPVDDSLELIEDGVISALIVLASEGRALNSYLQNWSMSAEVLANQPAVHSSLLRLEDLLKMPVSKIIEVNQTASEPRSARLASAVLMSSDLRFPIDCMIVGQAFLLSFASQRTLQAGVERALATLIREQWLRRAKFPPGLLKPEFTVPAIHAACGANAHGLKLAARILLAGRLAVNFIWPPDVLEDWRNLARE